MKDSTTSCSGFSLRFNLFLDYAGFPTMNQGRLTKLSELSEMSVAGVRKWVVDDNPPKDKKLINVCLQIIKGMTANYDEKKVAAWLRFGDDIIPSPFDSADSISGDHILMGKIYVSVHEVAKELQVDIYKMNADVLSQVYEMVKEKTVKNNGLMIGKNIIKSLLVLANDQ